MSSFALMQYSNSVFLTGEMHVRHANGRQFIPTTHLFVKVNNFVYVKSKNFEFIL